jgi:hypothetical protein
MAISRTGNKASHSQYLKSWLDGVPSVPRTKFAELMGIHVGKFTDKMHGWTDTSNNVVKTFTYLKLLQIT